ncbi:hypothetical protein [Synechococcus phage S-H25]|nr:hypothetical protein [Synechococcus phage S-H25]
MYQRDTPMVSFYLTLAILVLMIAYAGVDNTMKLFAYMDLELRWQWILFRGFFIRRKLEKELNIPRTSIIKHYQTYGKR